MSLSIGSVGTNFIEIKIQKFSFTKMHMKISSSKRRTYCSGRDESITMQGVLFCVGNRVHSHSGLLNWHWGKSYDCTKVNQPLLPTNIVIKSMNRQCIADTAKLNNIKLCVNVKGHTGNISRLGVSGITACPFSGVRPLLDQMITSDPLQKASVKFESQYDDYHPRWWLWMWRLHTRPF